MHSFADSRLVLYHGCSYFIVMDDIWDTQSWRTIKLGLVENNRGSRIIITTRTHKVAREASEVYELQPLSDDNSRKLFFARVSGGESKFFYHQRNEVSDKILRKCGGIPLAIITMASLLVDKPREKWLEVHRSIGFGNRENEQVDNTMRILSFSYYDLPSHLRTCLLYLSVFPEDYFIRKRHLIWMWIGEGFVPEKQGISSFEIGEGYFNELVNRSMIQLEEPWWDEEDHDTCCHVHDMVLDLIRSISSKENFVSILNNNEVASSSTEGKARRLALQNSTRIVEACNMDMQQVRSFISFEFDTGYKGVPVPLSRFKHVRVLAIHTYFGQSIERRHLEHLRNLLHLRYLRLSGYGDVVELPEELGTLKFLRALDVGGRYSSKVLGVTSVGHLTKLLCLRIEGRVRRVVPDGIGKLSSLEELHISYFGEEEEQWRRFVKELGSLRRLRTLHVGISRELMDARAVQLDMVAALRSLEELEHLSLSASPLYAHADTATWEAAGFLLPRHFRRLFLRHIIFSGFPSLCINPSRLSSLSHLTLHVDADLDEQDLRILGTLPELCYLHLGVQSTTEVVARNDPDAAGAGDSSLLFKKLRTCIMWYSEVRLLLPSKDDNGDSGGVSFRMPCVSASFLGSKREGVCGGKGIAPTLMPSVHELSFSVHVREFVEKSKGDCTSLTLEYFASLRMVRPSIFCFDASAEEVEQVESVLRRAADTHPNRPTLDFFRTGEGVQTCTSSDED